MTDSESRLTITPAGFEGLAAITEIAAASEGALQTLDDRAAAYFGQLYVESLKSSYYYRRQHGIPFDAEYAQQEADLYGKFHDLALCAQKILTVEHIQLYKSWRDAEPQWRDDYQRVLAHKLTQSEVFTSRFPDNGDPEDALFWLDHWISAEDRDFRMMGRARSVARELLRDKGYPNNLGWSNANIADSLVALYPTANGPLDVVEQGIPVEVPRGFLRFVTLLLKKCDPELRGELSDLKHVLYPYEDLDEMPEDEG